MSAPIAAAHSCQMRDPSAEEWALLRAAAGDRVCAARDTHTAARSPARIWTSRPQPGDPPQHRDEPRLLGAFAVLREAYPEVDAAEAARLTALLPERSAPRALPDGVRLEPADVIEAATLMRARAAGFAEPRLTAWLAADFTEVAEWCALAAGTPPEWLRAARMAG